MKLIDKKVLGSGTIVLTVQYSSFFGLIKTNIDYSSDRIIAGRFRNWRQEPDKLIVPDNISFQLDEWNNSF